GQLNAYGGRVELGGLISPGFVGLNVDGDKLSLNFPASSTRADISLTNGAAVYVAAGGGGDIAVNARNLEVSGEGSVLSTGIGKGLGNAGAKAGDITLNATEDIKIDGSIITNSVRRQGIGNGGNITLSTNSLSLSNGAQLQAVTFGQGDAGNVIINATKSVSLDGRSDIFSAVGDVSDTPEQRNATKGNGANIQITSPQLSLTNGAQLSASTLGQGNAGTIKVNAAEDVTISGKSSNFNSGLYVNSQSPTGTAGDIIVTSPRVTLDNTGILNAQSESGNGGNINLQSDLLIMRRGAQISTTAGTASSGGNGGNITINTPNGFIVAVPKENSNITANAFKGSGGKVQINATGIYGLTVLSREDLVRLLGTSDLTQEIDFQKLPSSITAISQTNPNLNGQVNLNTPDADPSRGLTQLPINLVDASSQIDNSCNPGSKQRASSFTITGRGGLPPNPGDALSTDAVDVGLVTLNHGSDNRKSATHSQKPTPIRTPIVQATGWTRNALGEVVLTADASTAIPQSPRLNPQSCHASRNN
ncbi:MAG: S-layer family protein, partial [Stigonema ocellatum SAG 48.90 = DSM 106950]|nr:S-layer family protein [Stigonema ocellatum SAG 48.90 = DSM 106950]